MAKKPTKKQPAKPNGTYFSTRSGTVGRTYPSSGWAGEIQAMDTTGYAKGKKSFDLKTGKLGQKTTVKKVSRGEVPAVIASMKKGATRREKW